MIHLVSKQSEIQPSLCGTPTRAWNQNSQFLPTSRSARPGRLKCGWQHKNKTVYGSRRRCDCYVTVAKHTFIPRKWHAPSACYIHVKEHWCLIEFCVWLALTWRWKVEKWMSGMKSTGWVSMSVIILKMVTSLRFWRMGTLTSTTGRETKKKVATGRRLMSVFVCWGIFLHECSRTGRTLSEQAAPYRAWRSVLCSIQLTWFYKLVAVRQSFSHPPGSQTHLASLHCACEYLNFLFSWN